MNFPDLNFVLKRDEKYSKVSQTSKCGMLSTHPIIPQNHKILKSPKSSFYNKIYKLGAAALGLAVGGYCLHRFFRSEGAPTFLIKEIRPLNQFVVRKIPLISNLPHSQSNETFLPEKNYSVEKNLLLDSMKSPETVGKSPSNVDAFRSFPVMIVAGLGFASWILVSKCQLRSKKIEEVPQIKTEIQAEEIFLHQEKIENKENKSFLQLKEYIKEVYFDEYEKLKLDDCKTIQLFEKNNSNEIEALPYHFALKNRDSTLLKFLHAAGCDTSKTDPSGNSALLAAVLEICGRNEENVSIEDNEKKEQALWALITHFIDLKFDLFQKNNIGDSPIKLLSFNFPAARNEIADPVILSIIEKYKDCQSIDKIDEQMQIFIFNILKSTDDINLLKFLILKQGNLVVSDSFEKTFLYSAVSKFHVKQVEYLIQNDSKQKDHCLSSMHLAFEKLKHLENYFLISKDKKLASQKEKLIKIIDCLKSSLSKDEIEKFEKESKAKELKKIEEKFENLLRQKQRIQALEYATLILPKFDDFTSSFVKSICDQLIFKMPLKIPSAILTACLVNKNPKLFDVAKGCVANILLNVKSIDFETENVLKTIFSESNWDFKNTEELKWALECGKLCFGKEEGVFQSFMEKLAESALSCPENKEIHMAFFELAGLCSNYQDQSSLELIKNMKNVGWIERAKNIRLRGVSNANAKKFIENLQSASSNENNHLALTKDSN